MENSRRIDSSSTDYRIDHKQVVSTSHAPRASSYQSSSDISEPSGHGEKRARLHALLMSEKGTGKNAKHRDE